MTCSCKHMWRRVYTGAKLVLTGAIVASFVAISGTAQATSYTPFSPQGYVFNSELVSNTVSIGDLVQAFIGVSAVAAGDGALANVGNSVFLKITAGEALQDITFTNQLPNADQGTAPFVNPRIGWFDSSVGGTGELIPETGSIKLSTSFAKDQVKYLFWSWDGIKNGVQGGTLQSQISAVPVPAGLVLFLSGLAGIGFLGRYKAKLREPAVA